MWHDDCESSHTFTFHRLERATRRRTLDPAPFLDDFARGRGCGDSESRMTESSTIATAPDSLLYELLTRPRCLQGLLSKPRHMAGYPR